MMGDLREIRRENTAMKRELVRSRRPRRPGWERLRRRLRPPSSAVVRMTGMPPSRRLYLHIGLQKTGTSYLQNIMWLNQDRLREQGLDLVPPSKRATFNLMLDVRERYNPEFDPPEVASALARAPGPARLRLAARRPDHRGVAGPGSRRRRSSGLLAACTDRDVHLVVTLRDLGRQIPSAWQQTLQSGGSLSYAAYLRRLRGPRGRGRTRRLWSSKDVAAILERWSAHVPAERIHLVTVPPPGSPQQTLLERYSRVLGIDPERLDRDVERSNESIGRVQAELLRRVNRAARARVPHPRRLRRHRQALPRGAGARSAEAARSCACRASTRSGAATCRSATSTRSSRAATRSRATSST